MERELTIKYSIFDNIDELPYEIQKLMEEAIKARENAYATYSGFKVGAAVLLENGEICIGSNQENAAYPSGLCAERVAVYQASARFPKQVIKAIALTGTAQEPTQYPVSPCGACRQSISEYEIRQKENINVYFMGASGKIIKTESIKDLLPFLFDGSLL
ncbi:cytidine deaminase [Capnocytophaga cynodegmi]|uniref:Cytidine deaminase n=1 Tax=Capnocytophaga cynodegmi TaxID=28189 RepID=A0A286NU02_9FLAO|nr:cytidine deaminase [Capnocytophaga cynodegmi]ATA67623.1 cytidine deaminase [Capnocytophaga cynodegmi]